MRDYNKKVEHVPYNVFRWAVGRVERDTKNGQH